MHLKIILKLIHKIKQSHILDENETSEKAADRATFSCAFRDLIAYHRPSLVRIFVFVRATTVLKLTCPFYATFTLMTVFIARSSNLVPSGVLKCVCHVLMRPSTTCADLL